MALTTETVHEIAVLARLGIDAEAAPGYAENLSAILGFVERLNAADTAGVEPLSHPLEMTQRLRRDDVSETDQREAFQAIAPATQNGLYLVPRVID